MMVIENNPDNGIVYGVGVWGIFLCSPNSNIVNIVGVGVTMLNGYWVLTVFNM